jgi:hypothetical protein
MDVGVVCESASVRACACVLACVCACVRALGSDTLNPEHWARTHALAWQVGVLPGPLPLRLCARTHIVHMQATRIQR